MRHSLHSIQRQLLHTQQRMALQKRFTVKLRVDGLISRLQDIK
jgi:hypothetical protein